MVAEGRDGGKEEREGEEGQQDGRAQNFGTKTCQAPLLGCKFASTLDFELKNKDHNLESSIYSSSQKA